MSPGGEALKGFPGEVVVVHHEHVSMAVAAGRVGVHSDQVVRTMHPLGQLHSDVTNAIHIVLRIDVELVGVEGLHVGPNLNRSAVDSREVLCPRDEVGRRRPSV